LHSKRRKKDKRLVKRITSEMDSRGDSKETTLDEIEDGVSLKIEKGKRL